MKLSFKISIYLFTFFSVLILSYRIIKTEELVFVFLVWNIFLAFIPFWVSEYLKKQSLSIKQLPLFLIWLLFIPNSPYILTDLFHLKLRSGVPLWYDLTIILSFAVIGLILFFRSFIDITIWLKQWFNARQMKWIIPILFWLIAFGLYLGRYLRYNSWDIIHPIRLAKSSIHVLFEKDTIGFTFIFTIFMWFIYTLLKTFNQKEEHVI